jgi:dimeric dUTPase (all-alpha-NTP-PPase superfamily)
MGVQKVTATQEWKNRMIAAKKNIPEGIGQQRVIEAVIALSPDLDSLANSTRWRNAWFIKNSDPEITLLVEKVASSFQDKKKVIRKRLSRQKITSN